MSFSRFFLLAMLAAPAAAAPSVPEPSSNPSTDGPPMRVMLVRGAYAGCEPSCEEWIYAEGRIDSSSLPLFRAALDAVRPRKPPILVHSGGGQVDTAMAIGRLVRERGFDVGVARTEFPATAQPAPVAEPAAREKGERKAKQKSTPPTAHGIARSWRATCASACTLILAAGMHRYVGPTAFVGVHEMVRPEQTIMQKMRYYRIRTLRRGDRIVSQEKVMVRETSVPRHFERARAGSETYRRVSRYLVEMGATKEVVDLMRTAPPERIRWLTNAELASTKLATEMRASETLVAYVPPPPLAPPPQISEFQPEAPLAIADATQRRYFSYAQPSWFDVNRGWVVPSGVAGAALLWGIFSSIMRILRDIRVDRRREPSPPPIMPRSD